MVVFHAAVALSVLTMAASRAILQIASDRNHYCSDSVNESFMSRCDLLKNNPGNFLNFMGSVQFVHDSGSVCVSKERPKNKFTRLTVSDSFHSSSDCCSPKEVEQRADRVDNGILTSWAQSLFDGLGHGELNGIAYYEVVPSVCSSKGAGCPLVVEISGSGGNPWAMTLIGCKTCNSEMNVVMIAPMLGNDEITGSFWVNHTFVAWASAYVSQASNIDSDRVYLASVSRGNEIAIQAAIYGAHIFSAVVMVGKFRFSSAMTELVQKTWRWSNAATKKLKRVVFHLGGHDDIRPDEEFYPSLTGILKAVTNTENKGAPAMHVYIYRGAEHDVTWTTWNTMYSLLWTADE